MWYHYRSPLSSLRQGLSVKLVIAISAIPGAREYWESAFLSSTGVAGLRHHAQLLTCVFGILLSSSDMSSEHLPHLP